MAVSVKLIEGFDATSTIALLAAKGWTQTQANTATSGVPAADFVTGRLGSGQALRCNSSGTVSFGGGGKIYLTKSLPAAYTSPCLGVGFNVNTLPGSAVGIAWLYAGATATFQVVLTTAGKIQIQNSSGTAIATGTTALSTNTWYYLEFNVVINGASGSVTVHINGSAEITTTTGNFGSTGVDTIILGMQDCSSAGANVNFLYDDVYLIDTAAGGLYSTFLGDVAVETKYPSAAGAHTQWTPDSGSNYARVNEHSGTFPDGDTSYVATSTVNNRDSYAFDDLSVLSGTVYAVQTNVYARKDNTGTRQIAVSTRPGSTDNDGATQTLGTSYQMFSEIAEKNPDTSAQWASVSALNATEFGIKLVS